MISPDERARGERLRRFCAAVSGKPVTWGVDDCSTWPAQWVAEQTGREFDWPAYQSRDEAHALIDAAGGLVTLWERAMLDLRLEPCQPQMLADGLFGLLPPVGAVGVIDTRRVGPVGVIFAHGSVACWRASPESGEGGGVIMFGARPRTILKAWHV